jgi:hypothetical protein
MGIVYLIHFAEGLPITGNRCAQHYIGYTGDYASLLWRLGHHRQGSGSRLMRAVGDKGIDWVVARVWEEGDRYFERRLKRRSNAPRYCPICAVQRRQRLAPAWPPGRPQRYTRREREYVQRAMEWHRSRERVALLEHAIRLRDSLSVGTMVTMTTTAKETQP